MLDMMTKEEIRAIRKAMGLTSDELGDLLGVKGNTVRRWECGLRAARGPAVTLLRRLAKSRRILVA